MFLQNLKITNFRGLSDISASFEKPTSVVVGPNAIGKTSIFEAIRAAKSVLCPRTLNEAQQTLSDMGGLSNQQLRYEALAGDVAKPINISLDISLTAAEVALLKTREAEMAMLHMRTVHGIAPHTSNFELASFLSTPVGKSAIDTARKAVRAKFQALDSQPRLRIHLTIDGSSGSVQGEDVFSQEMFIILETSLHHSLTYLSYFPADRAMPSGEVNIQVGAADSQAQLNSHTITPASKYGRLKNVVVNQMLTSPQGGDDLKKDFEAIFENLLKGKKLKGLSLNTFGGVSVQIEEKVSGKVYDIDRMSSGEKGVILLFLLMRRSVSNGAILMLDEPELHLNPAVCKNLLPFLIDFIGKPEHLQILICSHSAEILGVAFDREDCQLYHLRSGADLSPVYKQDKHEVFEALRRLGAKTSDVLFSKGTIFVEGIHDSELLDAGFPRLSGYKLTLLRGRDEIVKEIKMLQAAEEKSKINESQYFIFDRDRQPSELTSSKFIRVMQWDRYCFENYLLEADAIYDVCVELRAETFEYTRGSLPPLIKEIALDQLKGVVLRQVYSSFEPENAGLRASEINDLTTFEEMAKVLFSRIDHIKQQVIDLSETVWCQNLSNICEQKERDLKILWQDKWAVECDGKRVLQTLHQRLKLSISHLDFKKRILLAMSKKPMEGWRILDSLLDTLTK